MNENGFYILYYEKYLQNIFRTDLKRITKECQSDNSPLNYLFFK